MSLLDRERYQTVYAKQGSAVAAPTAGLHFTAEILQRVRARGIEIAEMTLDVGLGTFEPVRTERLEDHKIHAEAYEIPQATITAIESAQREQRPILAIGTTVVRALEDAAAKSGAARHGAAIRQGRGEHFSLPGQTSSASSINCSRISTCRNQASWRWWPQSPAAKIFCERTSTRSEPNIAFTATAIAC